MILLDPPFKSVVSSWSDICYWSDGCIVYSSVWYYYYNLMISMLFVGSYIMNTHLHTLTQYTHIYAPIEKLSEVLDATYPCSRWDYLLKLALAHRNDEDHHMIFVSYTDHSIQIQSSF